MANTNGNTPSGPAAAADAALIKTEENDIFKILYDCTNDMDTYRKFIYYVGTSCDNKMLRDKLAHLQHKLFKNVLLQKDSIIFFFKKTLNASGNNLGSTEKEKIERLVCFTLATLSYLETLVQKLNFLIKLFPTENSSEFRVNLGYEDSSVNGNEDIPVEANPVLDNLHQAAVQATQNSVTVSNDFFQENVEKDSNEIIELKNQLNMIKHLREEIEQLDVNLIRYNVRTESNEFIKKIKELNQESPTLVKIVDQKDKKKLRRCCVKVNFFFF